LAARAWNSDSGLPSGVDTLRTDARGIVRLAAERYAVVEVRDETRSLGSLIRRWNLGEDQIATIRLDTLRSVRGRWIGAPARRVFLDSSLQSSPLGSDGGFVLAQIPSGSWRLRLSREGIVRPLGTLRVESFGVECSGCDSVSVLPDPLAAPLWIDDFEMASNLPRLHRQVPTVSAWYAWWMDAEMLSPDSNQAGAIISAIGPDPERAGGSFHARFRARGPSSLVAIGLTDMELDWSDRQSVCFGYRADASLRVQLQRDSLGGGRPTFSASIAPSPDWRDVCLPFRSFVPETGLPDSLSSWERFGSQVLVIEFQSLGGTSLDLDDILVR